MACLVFIVPPQEHQIPYFLYLHHLLGKRSNHFKDNGHSAAQWRSLMGKRFNSYPIDYELSIVFESIVYQFHRLLAMKLMDLRARQIERTGRVGSVPARSRASHLKVCTTTSGKNSLLFTTIFSKILLISTDFP